MLGRWSLDLESDVLLSKYLITNIFTFKVSHICPDIGVQSVDNHLPVGRTSNLQSSIHETRCWWSSSPCIVLANVLCLWEEVELNALVKLRLADLATLKESLAASVECAVKDSKEDGSLLGEDLASLVVELS